MPEYTHKLEQPDHPPHRPVLIDAVVDILGPQSGERYLDLTAGYGGHVQAILGKTGRAGPHMLVDRDLEAVEYLQKRFDAPGISVVHSDYETILNRLDDQYDLVLIDSGVSSPQLDNTARGFSFSADAPLDMRMDRTSGPTAADLLANLSERDIADILWRYGEERQSRRIARTIAGNRPIRRTAQLAEIVSRAYQSSSRIHPATRTFQALRIAVNDELGQLERSLPRIESVLRPGGRMAVISFHSLEDRIVKQFIRQSSLDPVNKNVVQGKTEDVSNPRARSAKLRAAMKNTNTHSGGHPE